LKIGGPLYCYFYNEGETMPRSRKFNICGIYRTSLVEFDDMFVLGDLKHIQQLNGWQSNQISGYEITIDDFSLLESMDDQLNDILLNYSSENSMLKAVSIVTKYQLLFDWLSILDLNVWVILVLMVAVAGINMISGLLVIILERSKMIGILKAMGYPNFSIRKVFMYLSAFLAMRGLLWGNVIGIGLCLLQMATGIFKLDPVSYYLETVPIYLNFYSFLILNVGTLVIIVTMIILPSIYISKISPVESIRFD
jgi:lipoprotein-releasing system permease protein